MSRKLASSGVSIGVVNEAKYGDGGYYSGMIKSENGSADYVLYDDGSDTKQSGNSKGDNDAMTVHRRKMMRRAANRKSAQLSRARKKVRILVTGLFVVVVTIESSPCGCIHRRVVCDSLNLPSFLFSLLTFRSIFPCCFLNFRCALSFAFSIQRLICKTFRMRMLDCTDFWIFLIVSQTICFVAREMGK